MILPRHNDDNDENLSPLAQFLKHNDLSPLEHLMLTHKQQREQFDKQLEKQRKQKQYEE